MGLWSIGYLSCRDGKVHARFPWPHSRNVAAFVWARISRAEAAERGVRVFDKVRFF